MVTLVFMQLIEISDAITGLGVGAADLVQALMYSMPPLMGLLLPVSVLFATLLGVGRLASDREIRALAAVGVSPYRLLRVPFLVSVVVAMISGLALTLGEPWGVRGLRDLMSRSAQRTLAQGVRPGEFHQWLPGISFFAAGGAGDTLEGVFFADLRNPERPLVVSAKQGQVRSGAQAKDIVLQMRDGNMVIRGENQSSRVLHFEQSRYRIDVGQLVGNKGKTLMRSQERDIATLWRESRDPNLDPYRRATSAVTLYRRFTLPAATLVFALLAVPLACRATGNARARGFIYSALIVAAYYYVGRTAELSARHGDFPVLLAACLPVLLGSVAALVALVRFRRSVA